MLNGEVCYLNLGNCSKSATATWQQLGQVMAADPLHQNGSTLMFPAYFVFCFGFPSHLAENLHSFSSFHSHSLFGSSSAEFGVAGGDASGQGSEPVQGNK